ncbi:MAG: cyclodeaminase/cyclohydrolase family protein [Acidobacteria bacterium]|nr:cyclodeaminase/cyclohydrolase family protein [Acidobacteriota bacterium]
MPMAFAARTLTQFFDDLASSAPTPGGGTASAMAGAMGASLLMMVAGLPKTRTNIDEERSALDRCRTTLGDLRRSLTSAADDDAAAFDAVMAAFRQPKTTDEEQARRKAAIAAAMRGATEAPRSTLDLCLRALAIGIVVAEHGNPSASSDVRVAAQLLQAAAQGAAANIRINLDGMTDLEYRDAVASATDRALADVTAAVASIEHALNG